MKNIRAFIVFSSILLVAWLTASYSTQLDNTDSRSETSKTVTSATSVEVISLEIDTKEPIKEQELPVTAVLAGVK